MATVDEKGALDGGATSSLEGKENKPLGDATPTAVAGAQDGAQDGTPEIVYPSTTSFSLIALALCLIIYVITLDSTVLATAVPVITDEFDSLKDVGWYSSVYFNDDRHHTTSLQAPECAIFTAVAQTLTRGLEGDDKIAVLEALNDANVDSWKLPLALCCVSIIGAVTVERRKIRGKEKPADVEKEAETPSQEV